MIAELDVHAYGAKWLDQVRRAHKPEAGMARIEDCLGERLSHLIDKSSFTHADITPYARLGAMLPAQTLGNLTDRTTHPLELSQVDGQLQV